MRLLLGISLEVPICDNKNYTVINDHALACSFCAGHHWKLRHQRILFALQRELRQAGILMSTTDYMLSQKLKGDSGPTALSTAKRKPSPSTLQSHISRQPSDNKGLTSPPHTRRKSTRTCAKQTTGISPLSCSLLSDIQLLKRSSGCARSRQYPKHPALFGNSCTSAQSLLFAETMTSFLY
jgi:hypothetical protein